MVLKQIFLQIILMFSSLTMMSMLYLPQQKVGYGMGLSAVMYLLCVGLKLNIYFRSCHLILQ